MACPVKFSGLIAKKKDVEITYKTAVGKKGEKEIVYVMTLRLTRDQAFFLIIRDFMHVGILGCLTR